MSHFEQQRRERGRETAMAETTEQVKVERVQLGVRMEKNMVKVLKGLAEFNGVTLGQLLENIVLHSFEPVPGEEGEMAASPHGKRALAAIADLKRVYGMKHDAHAAHELGENGSGYIARWREDVEHATDEPIASE
jgi:hypothetical protein